MPTGSSLSKPKERPSNHRRHRFATPNHSNIPSLPTYILRKNGSRRTSPNPMQQQADNSTLRLHKRPHRQLCPNTQASTTTTIPTIGDTTADTLSLSIIVITIILATIPTTAATTSLVPATGECTPEAPPITITVPTTSNMDVIPTCPHRDRVFTSSIDLVGHLRINRTAKSVPGPGAPACTRRHSLNCPHCLRPFRHLTGLLSQVRSALKAMLWKVTN
nr:unnamed protein product [Spirometra erinaceieuropaei]